MHGRRSVASIGMLLGLLGVSALPGAVRGQSLERHARAVVAELPRQDGASASQRHVAADRLITLELHDVTLKSALQAIARQGEVALFYNDRDLPAERRVSVTVTNATVTDVVRLVLRGSGLVARTTAAGVVIEVGRRPAGGEAAADSTGSIAGLVTDSTTGAGVEGATVVLDRSELGASSDDDGRFRIAGVEPGTYMVVVRRLGYRQASRQVTVVANRETAVNVRLIPAPRMLDEVVTTGTVVPTEVKALPAPISVITARDIAQQHPLTTAAVIRQAVPTAVAFDVPNGPENTLISARGASSLLTGGSNVKVFIDGVEVADPTTTPIDPASIERIEVARGPQASTIYGADAAGGVIQIFTKRGDAALSRPRLDARVILGLVQTPYAGVENALRQQYTGSVQGGSEDVSYRFGGGYTRLANYVPDNGDTHQSNPRVYGGMHFARGVFTVDLSARHNHNIIPSVENPMVRTTGYMPESRPSYRVGDYVSETYGARLTASPVNWWRNELTMGVDRNTVQNFQTRPRLTTTKDTLLSLYHSPSRKLSVGYNTTIMGALRPQLTGSLTLGFDHYTHTVSTFSTSRALNSKGTIRTVPSGALNQSFGTTTNTGYFAQAQLSVRDVLFFTGGVRAENNSAFGTAYGTVVLPRVGVSAVHEIGSATAKIRGSYGEAFRAPSPGLASGVVLAGSIQLANPNLAPERQKGWDGGFDLVFGDRGTLSVTGFDQTAIDLISYLQVASTPLPTNQYQNIGRVSNRGIEVEGTLGLAQKLQLRAQYGYVRSRIEALGSASGQVQVGDEPLGVPAHTAGATLTGTLHTGTTLAAGVTYVGSYRQTDFLTLYRCLGSFTADACPASFLTTFSLRGFVTRYPGFAKINATVAHRFTPQLEAFVSVHNIANEMAFEGNNDVAVVGRTTAVGVHVSY